MAFSERFCGLKQPLDLSWRPTVRNEDAPDLFRISRRAPDKEAGAHMLRAGVGEKVQFS